MTKLEPNCRTCGTLKIRLKSGTLRCPVCRKRRGREYYHNSTKRRDVVRRDHYRRKYGASIEDLKQMLEEQQGRCAICRIAWQDCVAPKASRYERVFLQHLYVDHDHKTGVIRGLLCNNCNVAIARFDEKAARIANAILYLQRTKY